MNEPENSLENELSAMRPRALSTELRRRIADRLAEHSPAHSTTSWATPLFAGLASAGLAAALLLWLWNTPTAAPDQVIVQSNSQPAVVLNGGMPTLWRYHKAIRRSSADLDMVLGTRGEYSSSPREALDVAAFTRSPAQLRTLVGEL
jgi:hypothetical protein